MYLYLNTLTGRVFIHSKKLQGDYLLIAESENKETLKQIAKAWIHGFNLARNVDLEVTSTPFDFE